MFVSANEAVRDLHARYTDAVWRQDVAAFGDCFTDNAEWRISGMVLRGRQQIMDTIEKIFANYRMILMTFRTPILQVGNGTASGRTFVTEQVAYRNGQSGTSIGSYYEHFVQMDDGWKFSWRVFQLHYYGPADLTGTFYEQPDYGPPPAMPPLDTVPPNVSGGRWGLTKES